MSGLQLDSNPGYYRMSGSSVSTAYVTGTAALMLGANPKITANLTRMFLMQTAIKLTEPHMLEQGNGLVNTYCAVDFSFSDDTRKREFWKTPEIRWELEDEAVFVGGIIALNKNILNMLLFEKPSELYWESGIVRSDSIKQIL